jgi:hypothetical protein
LIKEAYQINILPRLKEVPEVVNIYCATANPIEVIFIETICVLEKSKNRLLFRGQAYDEEQEIDQIPFTLMMDVLPNMLTRCI